MKRNDFHYLFHKSFPGRVTDTINFASLRNLLDAIIQYILDANHPRNGSSGRNLAKKRSGSSTSPSHHNHKAAKFSPQRSFHDQPVQEIEATDNNLLGSAIADSKGNATPKSSVVYDELFSHPSTTVPNDIFSEPNLNFSAFDSSKRELNSDSNMKIDTSELQNIQQKLTSLSAVGDDIKKNVSEMRREVNAVQREYNNFQNEFKVLVDRVERAEKACLDASHDERFDQIMKKLESYQNKMQKLVDNTIVDIKRKADREDLANVEEFFKIQLGEIRSKRQSNTRLIINKRAQENTRPKAISSEKVQTIKELSQTDSQQSQHTNSNHGADYLPLNDNQLPKNTRYLFQLDVNSHIRGISLCNFNAHTNCTCRFSNQ